MMKQRASHESEVLFSLSSCTKTKACVKSQIVKYEEIAETDFEKYSDITNIDVLKSQRGALFISVFDELRETVLAN